MNRKTRLTILFALIIMIFALPATAFASKRLYQANLSGQGSARGSATVGTNIDGTIRFFVSVRNLTGDPTRIHIHSSADNSIMVTLCDDAGLSGVPLCPPNNSTLESVVGPAMMHVSGATLSNALDDSATYVNVHTAAFPGGEISGTLIPR